MVQLLVGFENAAVALPVHFTVIACADVDANCISNTAVEDSCCVPLPDELLP